MSLKLLELFKFSKTLITLKFPILYSAAVCVGLLSSTQGWAVPGVGEASTETCTAACEAGITTVAGASGQINGVVCEGATYPAAQGTCLTSVQALNGSIAECSAAITTAAAGCLESLSPNLMMGMAAMSAMSSLKGKGANEACGAAEEKMSIVETAMGAYNLECGGLKVLADLACKGKLNAAATAATGACGKAAAAAEADALKLDTLAANQTTAYQFNLATLTEKQAAACRKANVDVVAASAELKAPPTTVTTTCSAATGHYTLNLIAGAAMLVKMGQQKGTLGACKKATTAMEAGTVDCTVASNAQNKTCVCLKNPNGAGCANAARMAATNPNSVAASAFKSTVNGGGALNSLGGPDAAGTPGTSPGGLATAGGGSGGGGGGGLGGGGKGADKNKAGAAPGTPSTASSGGGGGSGGGSAGSGVGGYGAYGGAGGVGVVKPVVRSTATAKSEISGRNGTSNWDRVNNTYFNMTPTLIKP